MVVTLPLPPSITSLFNKELVLYLQWIAFWTFAALLIVPWLFCVYQLVTHDVGRQKRIKEILNEDTAPKTVVVMPVHNERPSSLMRAVNSIVHCDYPGACIHIFLSFDGSDAQNADYLGLVDQLGIPKVKGDHPESIDVVYQNVRVTVSRFLHGGKRYCQKQTFKLIDKIYAEYLEYNDDLFILFIDSDCILDKVCLQNFLYDMVCFPLSRSSDSNEANNS